MYFCTGSVTQLPNCFEMVAIPKYTFDVLYVANDFDALDSVQNEYQPRFIQDQSHAMGFIAIHEIFSHVYFR